MSGEWRPCAGDNDLIGERESVCVSACERERDQHAASFCAQWDIPKESVCVFISTKHE